MKLINPTRKINAFTIILIQKRRGTFHQFDSAHTQHGKRSIFSIFLRQSDLKKGKQLLLQKLFFFSKIPTEIPQKSHHVTPTNDIQKNRGKLSLQKELVQRRTKPGRINRRPIVQQTFSSLKKKNRSRSVSNQESLSSPT